MMQACRRVAGLSQLSTYGMDASNNGRRVNDMVVGEYPVAMQEGRPDSILLVDDHELIRLGFRALIESGKSPDEAAPAVFEAASLEDALAVYESQQARIAVVVLDLALPDANGLSGLMVFRQRFPTAALVVLSGVENMAVAQHALALGAIGFFPKSGDLGDMAAFVRACALHGVGTSGRQPAYAPSGTTSLSVRQLQILQWLLEGKSNREISQLACLSEGTVKNHVSMLLLSFDVRSRVQLISKLRP